MATCLNKYRADLHIHTVLSPCADIEMIPPLIVKEAISKSIDIIAITDHNSISNIKAVQKAAQNTDLIVIPGLELQTKEEIHTLCLFPTSHDCEQFYSQLTPFFPSMNNKPEIFGEQFVVDETGNFIRREERLLIASINISLEDAFNLVKKYKGLFIPAHIDNRTFGLVGQLGLIPNTVQFDALELSKNSDITKFNQENAYKTNFPLIYNSDAHQLSDIYGHTKLYISKPVLPEIQLALNLEDNRKYEVKYRPIN